MIGSKTDELGRPVRCIYEVDGEIRVRTEGRVCKVYMKSGRIEGVGEVESWLRGVVDELMVEAEREE